MTLRDKIENIKIEDSFRTKIGMMMFLSSVSHSENYFENQSFLSYKNLPNKVSNKIEEWHDKRQCKLEQLNERFVKDEDYVELDASPTKFDSSDNDEDNYTLYFNSIQESNGGACHQEEDLSLNKDLSLKKQKYNLIPKGKSNDFKGESGASGQTSDEKLTCDASRMTYVNERKGQNSEHNFSLKVKKMDL